MYGLLFVLLGAVGLNTGWIAAMSYDVAGMAAFEACRAGSKAILPHHAACLRPVTRPWAFAMLGGAVITCTATALLAVGGAVRMRRRVRVAGRATGPAVDAATARFAELAEQEGVAGRRPELRVLRPGARLTEPFTTGVPGRRPLVVVPAAVACAGPGVLDPVLRHELAHVRARDVLLASGAWWSGWVGTALPAAAVAPLIWSGATSYGAGLLVAVLLGGLLLLLRAQVLRLRELAADRAAADHPARAAALADLLLAAPGPGRSPGRLRSLTAVHPPKEVRVRALTADPAADDGGFLPSAVTALVLFIAVQPGCQVILNWTGWAVSALRPGFAVAGGLVAVLMMPVWARRYAADSGVPWWPPVLGVAIGGAAGICLPGPGLPDSPGLLALSTYGAAAPLLILALGGITVLLVVLTRGVDPDRGGHLSLTTLAGAGLAAVIVPAAGLAVIERAGGLAPAFIRASLRHGAAVSGAEPVLVLAAVAVLWVVIARTAPRPRPSLGLLVAVVVTATTTGLLLTSLRLSGDRTADLPLLWHRWWVAALSGAIVLVVLLSRRPAGRTPALRLTAALTAAAAVTLTGAVAQFAARALATGWDPAFHPGLLGQYVTVPLRLLVLCSAVAVPIALAAARWRPRSTVPVPLDTVLAAVVTAVVCTAVMAGWGEVVTGGVDDVGHLVGER